MTSKKDKRKWGKSNVKSISNRNRRNFTKSVKIKADSLEDAISIARDRYKNEEYILNEDNFMGAEFSEYKDEVIKEKKHKERER